MIKVLFASSEIYPYAKTGGLADVADALPFALKKHINTSRVMPFYGFMKEDEFELNDSFTLALGANSYHIKILTKKKDDLITYFIKAPLLSSVKNLYGNESGDYANNELRFGIFCMAIVKLSIKLGIEILHLNDWHTALSSLFIKEAKLKIKTVFTIHNLAYQGIFSKSSLKKLSIKKKYFNIDGLEFYDQVNFLKAGIAYSDHVTTVSPTYAKEIQTSEFGCGLDGFLHHHKKKFNGILNGINSSVFAPLADKALEFNYDKNSLDKRYKNKISFIKNSKLKDPRVPLFVMISRLVEQKGIDLLIESMKELLQRQLNLFILGDGDSEMSNKLKKLSSEYDNFVFFEGYNEILSHQTYASADFLLMPSTFEPCGLNQLIAMSYGAVPVVHSVGGLKDSVHENSLKCGSGFVYKNQSSDDLLSCVDRALKLKKDKKKFKKIVVSNMECDFSFENSALEYLKLYRSLL